ncbi:unnamed protein product [Arctia plantaginis]|uniref:PiggyBac transposable element-derived protein domain-containing protein n=1 Tax=Arctia plantaginis TaxID=874455 RepID=A0A8S0ZFZ0_ARCPL|nr:unnamed protein product [Arctia plantaginis]
MMKDSGTNYMINAMPYTGKTTNTNGLPQGEYYLKELSRPIHGTNRNIKCDNWFTSIPVSESLLAEPYKLTIVGAVRSNKREIPEALKNTRSRPVGTSIFCFDGPLTLLSYKPKLPRMVYMLSSCDEGAVINPTTGKPEIIIFYNQTKGGVDTFDQMCSSMFCSRKSNRWPMTMFYGILNIAFINSYLIYTYKVLAKQEKPLNRREYMKRLSTKLSKPWMRSRLAILTLSRRLRENIENILPRITRLLKKLKRNLRPKFGVTVTNVLLTKKRKLRKKENNKSNESSKNTIVLANSRHLMEDDQPQASTSKISEDRDDCSSVENTHIAFDNFFASFELLQYLFDNNIYATATVRADRTNLPKLIKNQKKKKDEPKPPPLVLAKGEYKWRVNQNVAFFVWKDTKLVYVLSTAYHPRQKTTCRRTQKDGSKSDVSCPIGILEYTKRMGGVDRFDQKRGTYSISRRSKRWWMRIFYFLVDSAITNAYIMYTQNDRVHNLMTSLHFRTVLARNLIVNFSSRKRTVAQSPNFVTKKPKGPTSRQKAIHGIPDELRLNDVGSHMPMELLKYRRCRACSSKNLNKTSKIQCTKCQVPLCIVPCFAQFHTP